MLGSVDYVLKASKGQHMRVSMATDNGASYFNILEPGENEVAAPAALLVYWALNALLSPRQAQCPALSCRSECVLLPPLRPQYLRDASNRC